MRVFVKLKLIVQPSKDFKTVLNCLDFKPFLLIFFDWKGADDRGRRGGRSGWPPRASLPPCWATEAGVKLVSNWMLPQRMIDYDNTNLSIELFLLCTQYLISWFPFHSSALLKINVGRRADKISTKCLLNRRSTIEWIKKNIANISNLIWNVIQKTVKVQ